MSAYALEWLSLLIRWFHFVAGISWIGASFYFIWLDDSLTPPQPRDAQRGVLGELWSVHGGGFYHNQKYLTGPRDEPLPQDLHWFKWEAYTTWLSGMAMLAIIYYANAPAFLIDRSVLNLTPAAAIAISLATIVAGWLIYDGLCRILFSRPLLLGITVYVLAVLAAYGLQHIFSGRAAYIHVGAILGTIMVANVFFVIIPGQRKMLAQIRAGQEPDTLPGRLGKIRSVHNTYLTLPVLFTMISNHYPMTYASGYGWLILALLGAAGVAVRYFFILSHRHRLPVALPAAAFVLLAAAAIIAMPRAQPSNSSAGSCDLCAGRTDRQAAVRGLSFGKSHAARLRHGTRSRAARHPPRDSVKRAAHLRTSSRLACDAAGKHYRNNRRRTGNARRMDYARSSSTAMTLSTHVLDVAAGIPAAALQVTLFFCSEEERREIAAGEHERGRTHSLHRSAVS